MNTFNYHELIDEFKNVMQETIKTTALDGMSEPILAYRCASVALDYIAKKRGWIPNGHNGDLLNFVFSNNPYGASCELEHICKHFKPDHKNNPLPPPPPPPPKPTYRL